MRDILTIIASLVIVLLTLALGVPYFIDWSDHRATIEARLSQALGVPVEISGPIDIKLLPTPTLGIQRYALGSDTIQLSGDAAHFELALVPLIRGEFQILEADLDSPRLSTTVDSTGAVALPAIPPGKAEKTQLDRVVVRHGTIVLNDVARQRSSEISDLAFDGSADTLFGPLKGQGRFSRNGETVAYHFSTGAAEADRLRVKAVFEKDGPLSRADLDGTLLAIPKEGRRQIGFEGSAIFSGRVGAKEASVPWRAAAAIKANAQSAQASNLELRLGDDEIALSASGEADVQFEEGGATHLDLASRQLDLDRFQTKFDLTGLFRSANAANAFAGPPVNLDWHADTITLGGDTAGEISARLKLDPGKPLRVAGSASLPARTRLSINGAVERGTAAAFNGALQFSTRDPERFADWIAPNLPDVAENLKGLPFKSLDIAGQAGISAAGVFIRELDARLDRTPFAGTLAYTRALGMERARLFADLTSPALDLERVPTLTDLAKGAATLDISAAIDAKAVKVSGVAAVPIDAGRIRAKLVRDATQTRLERLSIADLGGANIEASGEWRDGAAKLDAKLDASQLGELAALVARVAPGRIAALLHARAAALSPAHLRLHGESDPGRPSVLGLNVLSVEGSVGATRTSMRLAQAADSPGVSEATLLLESPEAGTLARQLGVPVLPLRGIGNGRVAAAARGSLGSQWTGRLDASFAGTTASLDGSMALDGMLAGDPDRPALSGNLKLASPDAVPLLQLLTLSPPGMTSRLPVDVGGHLDWTPITWRLDRLAGAVSGSAISGNLTRDDDAKPIRGSLALDRMSLATLARTILGPEQPARAGTIWSDTTFGRPLSEPPGVALDLKAARLDISDALAGSNASMHLDLAPGGLAINQLSMGLASGRVDGSLALRREETNVAVSGRLGFNHVLIDRPAFTAAIMGNVEFASSGKSEASLAAGLAGSGEIGLTNVRLNGLDPMALSRVVALSEDEKIGVEAKEVDAALARELDRAPFKSDSDVAYDGALAGGVLRLMPRSAYSAGQTRISLQPTFDLRNLSVDVQSDITLANPPHGWTGPTPQISVAWTKLLSQPRRRIESGPLVAALTARAIQREADRVASLEFDIKERAFFNRRLKWDRARQEERDRAAAEQARAEQERIEQQRRAQQELMDQQRRAEQERRDQERRDQERRAAEVEAARRRAEAAPTPPPNPFLPRTPPTPLPGMVSPRFRAPTADQDPSAAGRY